MNAWTLLGFLVGLVLGGLGTVLVIALCQSAALADERHYQALRDEFTGRLD